MGAKTVFGSGRGASDMVEAVAARSSGSVAVLDALPRHKVAVRASAKEAGRVAVITGGGSGHEPFAAGYLGKGGLDACVAGEIFASPRASSVLAAIQAVGQGRDVLLLVLNYTGDRLHFGQAAQKAQAEGMGRVRVVFMADDVATAELEQGRRGIAGAVLVVKAACAAAERGMSLDGVAEVALKMVSLVQTIGVAVRGSAEDVQLHIGLGIHGEPGVEMCLVEPLESLLPKMVKRLQPHVKAQPKDRAVLLVNNLGGTSVFEMGLIEKDVLPLVEKMLGVQIVRLYSGPFVTSLDMAGFSISVCIVDDNLLELLDDPSTAPAFWQTRSEPNRDYLIKCPETQKIAFTRPVKLSPSGQLAEKAITIAVETIREIKDELNKLDGVSGDGDCGNTLLSGANAIEKDLAAIYPLNDAFSLFEALADTVEREMEGSSGALYGIFFRSAALAIKSLPSEQAYSSKALSNAMLEGTRAVAEFGGAPRNGRTMLDAMWPAAETLLNELEKKTSLGAALIKAAEASKQGAASTAEMNAGAGRSAYVNADSIRGHPDPGATAFATIFSRIVGVFQ